MFTAPISITDFTSMPTIGYSIHEMTITDDNETCGVHNMWFPCDTPILVVVLIFDRALSASDINPMKMLMSDVV